MTERISIGLAQLDARVGNLTGNAANIVAARAALPRADVVLTPELGIVGYPPEDLVLKPALVEAAEAQATELARVTADGGPALLVGLPRRVEDKLYNAMLLLADGKEVGAHFKVELPNYGPFDEKRVFDSGPPSRPIEFRGVNLGVPICEDIWLKAVCEALAKEGADLFLAPHGSPFELGKDELRLGHARRRTQETRRPLAFLNRVGGQDELVFDGSSFVLNPEDPEPCVTLPDWEQVTSLTTWAKGPDGWRCDPLPLIPWDENPVEIYHALLVGLRDYVGANNFPGVVLGLSGGIDSALTAAIAVDALGPERVWCIMLPSRFTSEESIQDAAAVAKLLGVRLDTVSIAPAVEAFEQMLAPLFSGREPGLTEENIQSRARAVTLMALSNKFGRMLLTTGNKSEMSVGYTTLYGDLAGGYSVLKDVYKTTVFKLARFRNRERPRLARGPEGRVMPERVIEKPPTAELRENQKDEDSLPPYAVLDSILIGLVEGEQAAVDLVAAGADPEVVAYVERLLYGAEYKRRQAPPGVKIGRRSFGRDRRYPISNDFRTA